jgi:hypothetical protein
VDFRRGVGIGGCRVVAGQRLFLRANDVLRGGDVIAGWIKPISRAVSRTKARMMSLRARGELAPSQCSEGYTDPG